MTRALRVAVALLLFSLGPAAAGPGEPAPPAPSEDEVRFEALAETLDRAALDAYADPAVDAIVVIEAEEIGAVAEELLQEGEAALAVELLEQAIALLEPQPE